MKVVLIEPPIASRTSAPLGMAILVALTRGAGHEALPVYGSLLQPNSPHLSESAAAIACYAPLLDGRGRVECAEAIVDALISDSYQLEGAGAGAVLAANRQEVRDLYLWGMNSAEDVCASITAQTLDFAADLVGMSITTDQQKLPAAAVARKLRSGGYSGFLIAGGAAFSPRMARGFLTAFPDFDAVLVGDAEEVWSSIIASVGSDPASFARVPGLHLRGGTEPVPAVARHDGAHYVDPDYSDYVAKRSGSDYADEPLILSLDWSRGCWWGEKHQCRFCSVDAPLGSYQQRAAEDVVRIVRQLRERYRPAQICFSDSIMPYRDKHRVLAGLGQLPKGDAPSMYIEIKSTLARRDIENLARAGFTEVQPGIESFSTHSLACMQKGAYGLQHVSTLKHCEEYGLKVSYPLLVGVPGESADDLARVTGIVKKLHHLWPPAQVNILRMYQGSEYELNCSAYSLVKCGPLEVHRAAYNLSVEILADLCFMSHYKSTVERDGAYDDELAALRAEVVAWHESRRRGHLLTLSDFGAYLLVVRGVESRPESVTRIQHPCEKLILLSCMEISTLSNLARNWGGDPDEFFSAVAKLETAGLLLVEEGRALTLPVLIT